MYTFWLHVSGDGILKNIHIGWQHIKKMVCVTNMYTCIHQFNNMTRGGSNYTQNSTYFYKKGMFCV